jgi:hypothetical protein
VTLDSLSTASVSIGPVTPLGNGVYTFTVTGQGQAGNALLAVRVNDGQGSILLSPRSELPVRSDPLWASSAAFRAVDPVNIQFLLNAGPTQSGRMYALAASNSGSVPGFGAAPSVNVPLNPDMLFFQSVAALNTPLFPNTLGTLGPAGQAMAGLVAPPGFFGPITGTNLTFAYALLAPVDFASNPVTVSVNP